MSGRRGAGLIGIIAELIGFGAGLVGMDAGLTEMGDGDAQGDRRARVV